MKKSICKIKTIVFQYTKSLNWKMLIILGVFCVVLAILNNIFVDDSKSVEWIGSQPVLEVPE
jgi:Na+/H+ antiporter NhaA